jgi:hypothetical protein
VIESIAPAEFASDELLNNTDPDGAEITLAVTVIVSVVAVFAPKVAVTGRRAATPARAGGTVPAVSAVTVN